MDDGNLDLDVVYIIVVDEFEVVGLDDFVFEELFFFSWKVCLMFFRYGFLIWCELCFDELVLYDGIY